MRHHGREAGTTNGQHRKEGTHHNPTVKYPVLMHQPTQTPATKKMRKSPKGDREAIKLEFKQESLSESNTVSDSDTESKQWVRVKASVSGYKNNSNSTKNTVYILTGRK